jgi:pimeloyl-ACP methyl ester carboxylesterase
MLRTCLLMSFVLWASSIMPVFAQDDFALPPKTFYRTAEIAGQSIFYREAGDPARPTIILLHGYPTSSHAYRELIPMLSRYYHIIAPDYLGSGYSDRPDPDVTPYTFDRLADYVEGLLDHLRLSKYALYMHDFGSPVGFRLMERRPDAIQAIIVQNANAYLDGLSPQRQAFFKDAHDDRSPEHVATLFERSSRNGVINGQYLRDIPPEKREIVSPDSWTHDLVFLTSEKDKKIQVQLYQDYQTNIDRYPKWQTLMRERQYPALIVWGKKDPAFIAPGAEAYLRDLPKAEMHLLDAGHFAVEEQPEVIARYILEFMARQTTAK